MLTLYFSPGSSSFAVHIALTEVAGILFYLAKTYPEVKLLPDDAEGQARAVSWMSFIASTLHPARSKGMEHTKAVYGIADTRLGKQEWVLGSYSIADIPLFRLYWRFSRALDLPPGTFPNLA